MRPRDLRLIGKRQGIARITGETDLPEWRVDGTASIYETRDAAEAALIIDAFGPLDEPNYRVRGTAIQQRQPTTQDSQTGDQPAQEEPSGPTSIIERILPKDTQPESGTQQQEEDSKPDAGDVFRGILRGLQSQ